MDHWSFYILCYLHRWLNILYLQTKKTSSRREDRDGWYGPFPQFLERTAGGGTGMVGMVVHWLLQETKTQKNSVWLFERKTRLNLKVVFPGTSTRHDRAKVVLIPTDPNGNKTYSQEYALLFWKIRV